MKINANATIGEVQQRFPNGFSVGPGTPEEPGALSRILAASSHMHKILERYPFADGNQGYLVVYMDEEVL